MGWRIVKQPNGLLARFSEVVDDFTHYDMTEDEAVEVCREYMGRQDAHAKVERAQRDTPIPPWVEDSGRGDGLDRWRQAIGVVRAIHGVRVARRRERELSKVEPHRGGGE